MPKPRDNFSSERTGQKKKKEEEKVVVQSNPNAAQIKKQAQTEMRKQSEAQKNASKAQYAQNIHKEVSTGTRTVTSPEIKLAQQKAQKAQSYEATNNQRNRVDRFDHIPTLGEDTQKSKDKELMQKYESMDNYNVFERMFDKDKRDAYKEKQEMSGEYFDALRRNGYVNGDGNFQWGRFFKENLIPMTMDVMESPEYGAAINGANKSVVGNAGGLNRVNESVLSLATNPVESVAGVGKKEFDYLTGRTLESNPTFTSEARNRTLDDIDSQVGKLAYSGAMSMGDMAVAAALGGGTEVSRFISGAEKANETMNSAIDRNLSPTQILGEGAISGITTYATEKIPFEAISKAGVGVGKNFFTKVVLPLVKTALPEGFQEMAEDVADTIADLFIAKDKSELLLSVDEKFRNGMTLKEARKEAAKEWATNTIIDGLLGFISGATLGGINMAMGGANASTNATTDTTTDITTNIPTLQNPEFTQSDIDSIANNLIPQNTAISPTQNENINAVEPESVRSALSAYDQLVNDSGIESNPNERKAIIDNIINQNGGNVSENDMAKIQESLNAYEELARATGREITDAERRAVVTEMLNKVSENEWLNQDEIQIQERDNLASELENRDIITDTRMRRLDLEDDIERLKNGYATEHDKNIVIPQLEAELAKTDIYEVAYKRMRVLDSIEAVQNDNSIPADIKQMVLDKYNEDYERYNKIIEDYINKNAPIPSVETENTPTGNEANAIPTMAETVAPNPTVTAPANNIPSVTTTSANPTSTTPVNTAPNVAPANVNNSGSNQNQSVDYPYGRIKETAPEMVNGNLRKTSQMATNTLNNIYAQNEAGMNALLEMEAKGEFKYDVHSRENAYNEAKERLNRGIDVAENDINTREMTDTVEDEAKLLADYYLANNNIDKFKETIRTWRSRNTDMARALGNLAKYSNTATDTVMKTEAIRSEKAKKYYDKHKAKKAKIEDAAKALTKAVDIFYNGEKTKVDGKQYNYWEILEATKRILSSDSNNSFDGFTDADYEYVARMVEGNIKPNEIAERLEERVVSGNWGLSDADINQIVEIFKSADRFPVNSKNAYELYSQAYEIAAKSLPETNWLERLNTYRYMGMLFNPKTWLRNTIGNFTFGELTDFSDTVAGATQSLLDKMGYDVDRTRSVLTPGDKSLVDASKTDFDNYAYALAKDTGNKYTMKRNIENARKQFGNSKFGNALDATYNFMQNVGLSDMPFLKRKYARSLASYLKANGLDASALSRPEYKSIVQKARDFALNDAIVATFHEDSRLANALSKFSSDMSQGRLADKGIALAIEGVIPFKKTPINVLKQGINYSPASFINAFYDAYNVKHGSQNKNISNVIDDVSKGLTGTGLLALGMWLGSKGIIKGLNDDDDDFFGEQNYSINIGPHSYTIDWAAPTALPIL